MRFFKLISYEANILPISEEHNEYYSIKKFTQKESDFFEFILDVLYELKSSHENGKIHQLSYSETITVFFII